MDELVMLLFQSRDFAHFRHLSDRQLGQHMALNTYYEEVLGLIDTLVESYMRHDNTINLPTTIVIPQVDVTKYFTTLSAIVDGAAKQGHKEGIRNILAEIQTLIDQTLYRLSLENIYLHEMGKNRNRT